MLFLLQVCHKLNEDTAFVCSLIAMQFLMDFLPVTYFLTLVEISDKDLNLFVKFYCFISCVTNFTGLYL